MRLVAATLLAILILSALPAEARHRRCGGRSSGSRGGFGAGQAFGNSGSPYAQFGNFGYGPSPAFATGGYDSGGGFSPRTVNLGYANTSYASPLLRDSAFQGGFQNNGNRSPSYSSSNSGGPIGQAPSEFRAPPAYGSAIQQEAQYGTGQTGLTPYIQPPNVSPTYVRPAPAIYNVSTTPAPAAAPAPMPAQSAIPFSGGVGGELGGVQGVWIYEQTYKRAVFVPGALPAGASPASGAQGPFQILEPAGQPQPALYRQGAAADAAAIPIQQPFTP